jgi:hypothetical protein
MALLAEVVTDGGSAILRNGPFTANRARQTFEESGAVPTYSVIESAQIMIRDVSGGALVNSLVERGRLYVKLWFSGELLASGYLFEGGDTLHLREYMKPGPDGGKGFVRDVVSADPIAGAELALYTVPTNMVAKVHAANTILAQGITQTPYPNLVVVAPAAADIVYVPIGAALAASTTVELTWARGAVATQDNVNGGSMIQAFPDILLEQDDVLVTVTRGIGANTNYSVARTRVEEWVMPDAN